MKITIQPKNVEMELGKFIIKPKPRSRKNGRKHKNQPKSSLSHADQARLFIEIERAAAEGDPHPNGGTVDIRSTINLGKVPLV